MHKRANDTSIETDKLNIQTNIFQLVHNIVCYCSAENDPKESHKNDKHKVKF